MIPYRQAAHSRLCNACETYGQNYSLDTLMSVYALGDVREKVDRREQAYVGSGVAEGKNSVGVLILICVGVS